MTHYSPFQNLESLLGENGSIILDIAGTRDNTKMIELPPEVSKAIIQWRSYHPYPRDQMPVFTRIWKGGSITTTPITEIAILPIFKQVARQVGLRGITPESFRRSFEKWNQPSRSKAIQDWANRFTDTEIKG
jgi:integrase